MFIKSVPTHVNYRKLEAKPLWREILDRVVKTLLTIWSFFFKSDLRSESKQISPLKTLSKKELYKQMNEAPTLAEWTKAAAELDHLEGFDDWRAVKPCPHYDVEFIDHKLEMLDTPRVEDLVHELREGLLRNLAGIGNEKLYQARVGTKLQIETYIDKVVNRLQFLAQEKFPPSLFSEETKFNFFYETRQSFGRSALLLSGGASLGMYHLGVIKTLFEENLLPRVISGSSVGSIMASVVCISSNEELRTLLNTNSSLNLECFDRLNAPNEHPRLAPIRRKLLRLFKKGVLMDIKILEGCVRSNLGDFTFKEAYEKTGRILNITVASTKEFEVPRLLNYLTAPNVLIWSAALASCALRGLFEPVQLMSKNSKGETIPYQPSGLKWSDGSVGADLPMVKLSELFNVKDRKSVV